MAVGILTTDPTTGTIGNVKAAAVVATTADGAQVTMSRPDDPLISALINDVPLTGLVGQTAAGVNVINPSGGTTSTSSIAFRAASFQIVPTGTIAGGVISFEFSNDNANFFPLPVYDSQNILAQPVTSFTLATGVPRAFQAVINFTYLRARISTAVTGGGTVQCFSLLIGSLILPTSVQSIFPTPTKFKLTAAATTNATSVKATAGSVKSITLTNLTATVLFFKFYDKAIAPVVGTDIPDFTIAVPASALPQVVTFPDVGYQCVNGIALAITNLIADTDTTVVTAGSAKVAINYI